MAKQQWMKRKKDHDAQRIKNILPSNWGNPAFGTNLCQTYLRNGGIAQVVGSCLADVIDGSILMAEGKVPSNKMDPFVPPPAPGTNAQTGESLAQQHVRMERQLRSQINELEARLRNSEDDRKRAWQKMWKVKAELDLPQLQFGGRRGRIDMTNYHLVPVPALRNSAPQHLPRELEIARASIATYTPPRATYTQELNGSESKYSAARVRERISADGSVAPVSEPKKTRDGLYQRPAGRTRKGMQWDAIRGIWVPEGSQ